MAVLESMSAPVLAALTEGGVDLFSTLFKEQSARDRERRQRRFDIDQFFRQLAAQKEMEELARLEARRQQARQDFQRGLNTQMSLARQGAVDERDALGQLASIFNRAL